MEEKLVYHFCEETLGKDFTNHDLARPGDIIQIPEQLGMFEVVRVENHGDTTYSGVYLGASPWIVVARALGKNGLSNSKGQLVQFCQEYKNNTQPQTLANKVCNNLTFISKKGTESRRKLQDIFREIEEKVIVSRNIPDTTEKHPGMKEAIRENKEKWKSVLSNPDVSRTSAIRQIFESEKEVIWESEEVLEDDQKSKDQVLSQGYLVLLETMLEETWNDETMMKQVEEMAQTPLCKYQVIKGIDARLQKIKQQLEDFDSI